MSVRVDLERLGDELTRHGAAAFLVTVGEDGAPRTTSVLVSGDASGLRCGVGRHSAANAQARPQVSLLWPAGTGQEYALIVDGTAGVDGEELTIAPTAAVLHKVAGVESDAATCVALDDRHERRS